MKANMTNGNSHGTSGTGLGPDYTLCECELEPLNSWFHSWSKATALKFARTLPSA